MSKAQLAGNKEKNGTQRDVNSSLPEVGLTYSPTIYFIYIIYKCRCFAHDSTVTSLWLEYYTLVIFDKMHGPFMCTYFIYWYIFTLLQNLWVLVGGSLFRSGLCLDGGGLCVGVVGVSGDSFCGCGLYSDSDSESSSSLWEVFKPTRLNREEFLVTWWPPLCTVTILPFFFATVYCLRLYGGDSLFT